MKILYLSLKAEWYDMIESGVKTEEYREIKDYWIKRICRHYDKRTPHCDYGSYCVFAANIGKCKEVKTNYTHVCFSYGYTKRRMTFEVENITIGRGKPEWGAPEDRDVFIIKLGKKN